MPPRGLEKTGQASRRERTGTGATQARTPLYQNQFLGLLLLLLLLGSTVANQQLYQNQFLGLLLLLLLLGSTVANQHVA